MINCFIDQITFKPTSEIQLRESEIIVVSVINLASGSPPQVAQSTTQIGTSQSTLKGGNDGGALRNAIASQQQTIVAAPAEEEVARIRLKITAKATYSK